MRDGVVVMEGKHCLACDARAELKNGVERRRIRRWSSRCGEEEASVAISGSISPSITRSGLI